MFGSVVAGLRGCVAFQARISILRICTVSLALAASPPAGAMSAPDAIFGAGEIRSENLAVLTKWTATLARHRAELRVRHAMQARSRALPFRIVARLLELVAQP